MKEALLRRSHCCNSARPLPRAAARLQCTAVATAAEPGAVRSSEDIFAWAARLGVKSKALSVADFQGLRGLRAEEAIAADEPIASVPLRATLLVRPRMRCPFPELCPPAYWSQASWYVQMALLLLHKRRQEGSQLAYIRQLPPEVPVPMNWSREAIDRLGCPYLIAEVREQQAKFAEAYRRFEAGGGDSSAVPGDDFYWALQLVRSRSFSGPYAGPGWKTRAKTAAFLVAAVGCSLQFAHLPLEQVLNGGIAAVTFNILYDVILSRKLKWYAMLPLIDLANHSSSVSSDVRYEFFQDMFAVSCNRAFQKGQQVLISYGKMDNDSLLQYYGFVEADNCFDTYTFLLDTHQDGPDSLETGHHSMPGRPEKGADKLVVNRGGVTVESEAVLRTLCSNRNKHEVLVGMCDAELTRLRRAKGEATDKSVEGRLASQYRIQKDAVLLGCKQACEKKLSLNKRRK